MTEVVILLGAEKDLLEHYIRLEGLNEGLGARLDADFAAAMEILAGHPEIAPRYGGRFRRQLLRRWHLGIFYAVTPARVVISRVLDLRQNPSAIKQRLGLR